MVLTHCFLISSLDLLFNSKKQLYNSPLLLPLLFRRVLCGEKWQVSSLRLKFKIIIIMIAACCYFQVFCHQNVNKLNFKKLRAVQCRSVRNLVQILDTHNASLSNDWRKCVALSFILSTLHSRSVINNESVNGLIDFTYYHSTAGAEKKIETPADEAAAVQLLSSHRTDVVVV